MSVRARFEYLQAMQNQYRRASRPEKTEMLDSMQMATGQSRKHLIYQMGRKDLGRRRRSRERGPKYTKDVEEAIAVIADAHDWISAPRLQPTLLRTAQDLVRWGEVDLTQETLGKLSTISTPTVGRILVKIRPAIRLPQAHYGRRVATQAQQEIAESVIPWDIDEPGHFEVDLVHHGVPDAQGRVICTIQFLDVLTGWSERYAIMGFTFDAIWGAIQLVCQHCPIAMREFHTDNGSEFINWALISAFGEELVNVTQTRGRPHHSNDNRLVEQKNGSLVRAYLGYAQLHTYQQLDMLNALYADMWLYYNLFQPVLRQIERKAVRRENGIVTIQRKQDQAKTPLERLLKASPPLSVAKQSMLLDLRDSTNLVQLKRRIHAGIAELMATVETG